MRRILATSLAVASLASLTACNADRSGTLSSGNGVTLNSCSGAARSTEVSWSGAATSSVRVTYRTGSTNARSAWVAASGAASGTVSVSVPANATSDAWAVYKVELATAANGLGTKTSVLIDCATAVTTTTAPVVTEPPATLPPDSLPPVTVEPSTTQVPVTVGTTAAPTCSTLPVNTSAPTISKRGDGFLHLDEGAWEAGPNCSLIGWAHQWERSFNNGPWQGFSGLQDWVQPCGLGYRYRVTVTKANQLGNTDATSGVETGSGC